jgi:hypothetical protein
MHKVHAIHLMLRFNAASFATDAPIFFKRFGEEIFSSKKIEANGGGFGTTHWLRIFKLDGSSMQEQDRTELLIWLNQQREVKIIDCKLDDIKAEPYLPSLHKE